MLSESIHTPPWKVIGNSLGEGGGLEKSVKLNWNFLGDEGVQSKKPSVAREDIFWNYTFPCTYQYYDDKDLIHSLSCKNHKVVQG